ncbi:MAG: TPM domain-containing protein [Phenylobacterium sp.]|uniref:TPM domain-containing protein n=1 Tax=Phenylobacterium sp. TaxID=1871053 RepID=UPI003919EA86
MLNDEERRRIEEAVRAAELRTSGEIYCVLAEESSDYRETPLAWAAIAALLGPAALLLAGVEVSAPELLDGGWSATQVSDMAEVAARSALVGAILLQGVLFVAAGLLAAWGPIRRVLTPRPLKRERVRGRARELFLAKNLSATRARTGVLIYVSMAEHMAELVADEGISSRVEPGAWDRPMAALIAGLKRGETGSGFAAAVGLCAEILAEHAPADRSDNPNELPDAVVELPRL